MLVASLSNIGKTKLEMYTYGEFLGLEGFLKSQIHS